MVSPSPWRIPDQRAAEPHAALRETLAYGLLAALALSLLLAALLLYQYIMPRPQWVSLGHVDDFPVDAAPILARTSEGSVWVVHLQGQFVVLAPLATNKTQCAVTWQPYSNQFYDPCLGTRFSKTGIYAFDLQAAMHSPGYTHRICDFEQVGLQHPTSP